MSELPLAPCGRILKKANPEMKFSKEAKEAFAEALEQEGLKLSKIAVELAKKEGRKTIQSKDIMRWKPFGEEIISEGEFLYKLNGRIHYSKTVNIKHWRNHKNAKILPVKFLNNVLLFGGRLYEAKSISEAERIMESKENEILESLMEPHWAYSPYEFRDWEPIEKINKYTTKLEMWFDDYDGGDQFIAGYFFQF